MNPVSMIVLMCLATGASAGSLGGVGLDFEGLNKFLEGRVADINTLKENLNSLSGSIKEAAQSAINVADASECNQEIISDLANIKEAGLNPKGNKTVETLLSAHLTKIADQCAVHLDQAIADSVDTKFSSEVSKHGDLGSFTHLYGVYAGLPKRAIMIDEVLHGVAWKMAKADRSFHFDDESDKKKKFLPKVHQANIARAFEKYLDGRCPEYATKYKELFEATAVIGYFVDPVKYIDHRSESFKDKALTYEVCRAMQVDPNLRSAAINLKINPKNKYGFESILFATGSYDLPTRSGGSSGSGFVPAVAGVAVIG